MAAQNLIEVLQFSISMQSTIIYRSVQIFNVCRLSLVVVYCFNKFICKFTEAQDNVACLISMGYRT